VPDSQIREEKARSDEPTTIRQQTSAFPVRLPHRVHTMPVAPSRAHAVKSENL
jgi:hypothetical protein